MSHWSDMNEHRNTINVSKVGMALPCSNLSHDIIHMVAQRSIFV
jgi:hypothetical protein